MMNLDLSEKYKEITILLIVKIEFNIKISKKNYKMKTF